MESRPAGLRSTACLALLGAALLGPPSSLADDALSTLPPLPSGALRVFLVRHGQALSNLEPAPSLPPEQPDHLTPLGRQQAEAAGRALAGLGVSAAFASPASRARETAEGMSTALGLPPPSVEPRLRPMDLGRGPDGRGLTWKDRGAAWEAGRDPTPAGGESMERVGHRMDELVRAMARSRRGRSIVMVTHGEVLAAYLGEVRGTPAPRRYPPGLANGSITVVDVLPNGAATIRLSGRVPR
jgi:broad specificity phosphatase PhoE